MTDTANAPERIWMTAEDRGASWPGAFRAFRCSDLDHSNDDGPNPDYPEYVLSTHCDELVAAAYVAASEKAWAIAVEMELHAAIGSTTKAKAEAIEGAILSGTPDNARAALTAYGERMKAEGAREAQEKIARLTEALNDIIMCDHHNFYDGPPPRFVQIARAALQENANG